MIVQGEKKTTIQRKGLEVEVIINDMSEYDLGFKKKVLLQRKDGVRGISKKGERLGWVKSIM